MGGGSGALSADLHGFPDVPCNAVTVVVVLLALSVTGALSAYLGGARLVLGGALAMAVTYGIGQFVGAAGVIRPGSGRQRSGSPLRAAPPLAAITKRRAWYGARYDPGARGTIDLFAA
ncbi:MAG: hypothetical protein ACXWZL_05080 [Mycobacterium sp.]